MVERMGKNEFSHPGLSNPNDLNISRKGSPVHFCLSTKACYKFTYWMWSCNVKPPVYTEPVRFYKHRSPMTHLTKTFLWELGTLKSIRPLLCWICFRGHEIRCRWLATRSVLFSNNGLQSCTEMFLELCRIWGSAWTCIENVPLYSHTSERFTPSDLITAKKVSFVTLQIRNRIKLVLTKNFSYFLITSIFQSVLTVVFFVYKTHRLSLQPRF